MTQITQFGPHTTRNLAREGSTSIALDKISIVIPVKNNQPGIDNYLANFFKTHKPESFPKEIIIVDNNSERKLDVTKFQKMDVQVRLFSTKKTGPAAARNFGVDKSTGDWILFNDSDCIPAESLLTGYFAASNGAIGYAGNIRSRGQGVLSKYYASQRILIPLDLTNTDGRSTPQYIITANALVWRKSFEKVNGFNEEIKIAGGEDIDLGLRLAEVGKLSYAFESIVDHDFNGGLVSFCKRFYRYGQGNRIIEELWGVDMRPTVFRPNERGIVNEILAKLQYLSLLCGYRRNHQRMPKRS